MQSKRVPIDLDDEDLRDCLMNIISINADEAVEPTGEKP